MLKNNLPVILLKGLVLLPLQEARIELNNDITKKVIDLSKEKYNNEVLIIKTNNELEETPDKNDLSSIGILTKITSRIDLPNGNSRIILSGVKRVKILSYSNNDKNKDILESTFIDLPRIEYNIIEETALKRKLIVELENYISANPFISNSIINQIKVVDDLDVLTDTIANFLPLTIDKKAYLMNEASRISRAKRLISELNIELAILEIENKLENDLKTDLDQMQKEMILKEKIKIIKDELGEKDSKSEFVEEIESILKTRIFPENIHLRINEELNRYQNTLDNNPESSTIRNYIETLIKIPFGKYTNDEEDLKKVENTLNESHYGLNEVKTRILEYTAVSINNKDTKSPVICLIGPPGVGKTTLAKSIAASLNKNFAKISLGGINDPAELLGHRRTYIGSEPGKIINALIKSNSMNPLILLDEVDKMSADYKGDPVNVLLDLLDNSQNNMFTDNFVEEKIDLSKVSFILTANDKHSIPLVLQDRLEIIELNSYLDFEKIEIASKYLIKNALINNGLNENSIIFKKEAISFLIENYTKESGVRELDRLINSIIRKLIVKAKLENKKVKFEVGKKDIVRLLGEGKYNKELNDKTSSVGYIKGLAYTPSGGEVLEIEVNSYVGKEEFITSGHLGETLKESIIVSLGYIKSNIKEFNINADKFNKTLHINFREGGIPKEGPSAGTVITSVILSHLLDKPFPTNISSSGEITLLGDVLPIGGLREKSLAAIKNKIDTIYLSYQNKKDVDELPIEIKSKIKFIFIKNYKEMYKDIFK